MVEEFANNLNTNTNHKSVEEEQKPKHKFDLSRYQSKQKTNLESRLARTKTPLRKKETRNLDNPKQIYQSNQEDKNIELLGFKNTQQFNITSKYYQIQDQFINDSFKDQNYDARINIIELSDLKDKKLIGMFTVKDETNKLVLNYINALYQSLIVGRKRGAIDEIVGKAKEFEKKHKIDRYEALSQYSKLFENQRAEIAQVNTNIYYNIFAAALQLTDKQTTIDSESIKQIQKLKIYPLTEMNQESMRFFGKYLV